MPARYGNKGSTSQRVRLSSHSVLHPKQRCLWIQYAPALLAGELQERSTIQVAPDVIHNPAQQERGHRAFGVIAGRLHILK